MKAQNQKPAIFEYDNYRKFLNDEYHYMKSISPKISFRYLSRMAGFLSPNFFKLVIDGKRNLSSESIEKVALAFKLSKEERTFFRNLVMLNQAANSDEKRHYAEELMSSSYYKKVNPLKKTQYAYYTNWYYIPIRELVATKGFKNDPEWVAHQLTPPITASEAKKALEDLLELGLVKLDECGRLVQSSSIVSTGDEVSSISVMQFHREMMQKAGEALDRFPGSEREISSITLSLSEETSKKFKVLIQKFRKELLALSEEDKNLERVYQLNFQLFPVSKKDGGEEK